MPRYVVWLAFVEGRRISLREAPTAQRAFLDAAPQLDHHSYALVRRHDREATFPAWVDFGDHSVLEVPQELPRDSAAWREFFSLLGEGMWNNLDMLGEF